MSTQNCIPIYGRGGDNADPRKKMGGAEQPADSKDAGDAVPRRPAGQRPAPVQVRARGTEQTVCKCMGVSIHLEAPWADKIFIPCQVTIRMAGMPCPCVTAPEAAVEVVVSCPQRGGYGQGGGNLNMQPGLGIIPTLFGFQQNQGARLATSVSACPHPRRSQRCTACAAAHACNDRVSDKLACMLYLMSLLLPQARAGTQSP